MTLGWRDRIVVVGTGPAGMAAADELRRLGFTGELTVLGDEAPYDRPACSKGVLSGHQKPSDVRLPASEAPMDLRLGRRAVHLDPQTCQLSNTPSTSSPPSSGSSRSGCSGRP